MPIAAITRVAGAQPASHRHPGQRDERRVELRVLGVRADHDPRRHHHGDRLADDLGPSERPVVRPGVRARAAEEHGGGQREAGGHVAEPEGDDGLGQTGRALMGDVGGEAHAEDRRTQGGGHHRDGEGRHLAEVRGRSLEAGPAPLGADEVAADDQARRHERVPELERHAHDHLDRREPGEDDDRDAGPTDAHEVHEGQRRRGVPDGDAVAGQEVVGELVAEDAAEHVRGRDRHEAAQRRRTRSQREHGATIRNNRKKCTGHSEDDTAALFRYWPVRAGPDDPGGGGMA
jgi:hypothetical protein